MEKFNCTTPLGKDKTSICEDPETASRAVALYNTYKDSYNGSCLPPCNFQRMKITALRDRPNSNLLDLDFKFVVIFHFQQYHRTITSFYVDNFTSIVGEIGGWVGIFLGMSVFNLTNVFDWLFKKFE